jgi:DNA polymerase III sliding clamp (beta) subunit (PCNA family)
MLKALKFVNRATADKDIIRALTHICVHDGKLQGADSKMAIEADCPELEGFSFTTPAEKFIKAVVGCKETPTIVENADGTIKVSHKRFRVTLPTLGVKDYPRQTFKPDNAVLIDTPEGFLPALRKLVPFISQDASRPWSLGVCLGNTHFYATNNVTMARVPVPWNGPIINLPRYIIEELLEINQPVLQIWASPTSISFQFDGAWLRAQLYTNSWPNVSKMFDVQQTFESVPEGLLESVEQLIPFCPDVKFPTIYFKDGSLTTANGMQSAEVGFDWAGCGVYRAEVLQTVLAVAKEWTPANYPKPVFFKGTGIEGLMIGVRK